jgi:hypothetical protein
MMGIFASGMNSRRLGLQFQQENDMQMKAILEERLLMGILFFECRKEIKRQSFSQFHWILLQTVEGIRQIALR